MPAAPFYDPTEFAFTRRLIEHWREIREEALRLSEHHLMPYPVREFYQGDWKVLGLYGEPYPGQSASELLPTLARNRSLCPRTTALCEGIPNSTLAGFSMLEPGCEILPHRHQEGVFICHLGLVVPEHCAIRVEAEERAWKEGECLVFHEKNLHSAYNRSGERRIVFLVDFDP